MQNPKKRTQRFKQCSETTTQQAGITRRDFIKMTGAAGAAMTLAQPFAKAWGQTTSSIAPLFPGSAAGHPGLTVDSSAAISALLAYDPATDADAKYFRSRVPLSARIPAFAATQAQPNLSAAPQVTNLSQYYESTTQTGNSSLYQYSRYGSTTDPFVTRFQQYQDIVGGWQGAQALPSMRRTAMARSSSASCFSRTSPRRPVPTSYRRMPAATISSATNWSISPATSATTATSSTSRRA